MISLLGMNQVRMRALLSLIALLAISTRAGSEVHVTGEMRRMFTAQDIGPNVALATINRDPHLYALGPLAGLKGEITVSDGQVFVSKAKRELPSVLLDPNAKSVFLVYASVPTWRSLEIPANVITELDLAAFVESQMPTNTRSAFLVHATARAGRYHVQNYEGKAKDLTHEAHEEAKVFYNFADAPVELVGFFTNCEGDAGSFVHRGQTTHIHVISMDHKHMGHLESIQLAPGASLLLPETLGTAHSGG